MAAVVTVVALVVFCLGVGCAREGTQIQFQDPWDVYGSNDTGGGSDTGGTLPDGTASKDVTPAETVLPDQKVPDLWEDPEVSDAEYDALPDMTDVEDLQPGEVEPEVVYPAVDPGKWGPHQVGTTSFQFLDYSRLWPPLTVNTTVWYPALPTTQPKASYLMVISGNAYTDPPPDKIKAPYPVVLFSHGFRGISAQSIAFTEYLASHGYVVIAMDHSGNTLTDFFSDDAKVAQVALRRPSDVLFAYKEILAKSNAPQGNLSGMADQTRVAMTGHSFGGWTALMIAGGEVNVSEAQAACQAGTPADIFCDYVWYWPAGQVVKVTPGIPALKAAVVLTPGGSSAFGPQGLSGVKVPTLVFGGTLDPTTPVDIEILPIYESLPTPKALAIVETASHMSFTNVCSIPGSDQFIKDFCGVEGMAGPQETFATANPLAVAFLNYYVKGDTTHASVLSEGFVEATYPKATWQWEQ
jgi:predicted dienelactone hydrolase